MNQLFPIIACTVFFSSPLLAEPRSSIDGFTEPTFSYTQIGFKTGRVDPKDDFSDFDVRDDTLGAIELSGSYQINQNLFIGGEFNQIHKSERRYEGTFSSGSVFLGLPLDASENVDLIPTLGLGRFEAEACVDRQCLSEDDTAAVFGANLRIFAIPDILELSLGVRDNTLEDSEPYFLVGIAGWLVNHHRVSFDYVDAEGVRAFGLGYMYHW